MSISRIPIPAAPVRVWQPPWLLSQRDRAVVQSTGACQGQPGISVKGNALVFSRLRLRASTSLPFAPLPFDQTDIPCLVGRATAVSLDLVDSHRKEMDARISGILICWYHYRLVRQQPPSVHVLCTGRVSVLHQSVR